MKHSKLAFIVASLFLFGTVGCKEKSAEGTTIAGSNDTNTAAAPTVPAVETKAKPNDFIPEGYVFFEETEGDLNKDGLPDRIIMIKGTDKAMEIVDENRGPLDRNRRGILVLFNTGSGYTLAAQNNTCFSSENEEGGVYYAPELDLSAEKGNLYIHYAHGRYGYWRYIFRFQNGGFELIGYDASSDRGPVIQEETSINFSTGKKIVRTNTNEGADSGEEVFETTKTDLSNRRLYNLENVRDFDELELPE